MPCRSIETSSTVIGTTNYIHDEVGNLISIKVLSPPGNGVLRPSGFLGRCAVRDVVLGGVATNRPPKRPENSLPDIIVIRNDSLGTAIDCEAATAHWHGERIDYDHAMMVAMASWGLWRTTRPEAGTGGRRLESVVGQLGQRFSSRDATRAWRLGRLSNQLAWDAVGPSEAIRCGAGCRWDGDVGR